MRLLQSCTAHHLCAAVEHPVILHRHLARLRVHEAPAHSVSSGGRCHACAGSVIAYLQNQSGICLSTGLTSRGAQHPEALGALAARNCCPQHQYTWMSLNLRDLLCLQP